MESIPDEAAPEVAEYLDRELRTGDYPHIAALLGEGDSWVALRRLGTTYDADRRFEQGYVGSSTASPPNSPHRCRPASWDACETLDCPRVRPG